MIKKYYGEGIVANGFVVRQGLEEIKDGLLQDSCIIEDVKSLLNVAESAGGLRERSCIEGVKF